MSYVINKTTVLIGIMMLLAAASAEYLKPTKKLVDSMPLINLEQMIPLEFASWKSDQAQLEQIVDPNTKQALQKIYAQTLTRIYLNPQGGRIMLSIAYGGDQSKEFEVHRPEVCYTAQGFQVFKNVQDLLATKFGSIPVKRIYAVQGNRTEPITYWIMVGSEAAVGIKVKLAQVRYGLTGAVPDGMLVRISSISSDDQKAYLTQDGFIRDMLSSMSPQDRARLIGNFVQ
jgi:EpsI family protein